MKKTVFLIFLSLNLMGQSNFYTHQVFVLNEGYFDYTTKEILEPVTLGSFNPTSNTYITLDTIKDARFASDILVDDQFLYIAADSKLLRMI